MAKYHKTQKGRTVVAKAKRKYKKTQKGKDKTVSDNMKWRYGITLAEYDEMFETQDGVCAICELPSINCRLSVDHDHKTGKVRGLLCHPCNMSLGVYEKRKDKFEDYLRGI
ncbi:hypothetical protein LCGC14_0538500 [marine sediment metagenome]|uniref:Recombination endonuclease VII n=1 Tax=marine sediment metagenome TaxID=412755 RepID=A0A0F9RTJ8_9ZZZZ